MDKWLVACTDGWIDVLMYKTSRTNRLMGGNLDGAILWFGGERRAIQTEQLSGGKCVDRIHSEPE